MSSRRTDDVTRVDIRIPNELYDEISQIAIAHFNAKIHHRSKKPEVTSTILELIKIGIAHLESTSPVTDEFRETISQNLQKQIASLNSRLKLVETKLSRVDVTQSVTESDIIGNEEKTELTDLELSRLLGVSNIILRDYRVYRKKPQGKTLARILAEEWEITGSGWVRK